MTHAILKFTSFNLLKKLVVVRRKRIFNNYEVSRDYRINYGGSAEADYILLFSIQACGLIYMYIYIHILYEYLNQRKLKKDTGQSTLRVIVLCVGRFSVNCCVNGQFSYSFLQLTQKWASKLFWSPYNANPQILGLIPPLLICTFLRCASLQIANFHD